MVEKEDTITLAGSPKFGIFKFTGGDKHESSYTGQGEVTLAPALPGNIVAVHIDSLTQWRVGKDAYLASAGESIKEDTTQGLVKDLSSEEDMFVYNVHGNGVLWLKSSGAITKKDLEPGQSYVVENGLLVAWNMEHKIEKIEDDLMTAKKPGGGLFYRFEGPGTIYVQTRNQGASDGYAMSIVPSST